MSRYPTPRQFDPRQPLEVRVSFRWAGRDYEPGQPFNWRQKGIDMRRVRQMFEAGKLRNSTADPEPDQPEAVEPDPAPKPFPEPDFDLSDGLDEIDSLSDLKQIAEMEGAPTKRSKDEQRQAIRDFRSQHG